jgi:hypothetical protein
MDSTGGNFVFNQTGGSTSVGGTLDCGHGIIQMHAGTLTVAQDCAMGGCDSGGSNVNALAMTGGTLNLQGSFQSWNPAVSGGTLNIGATGTLNPSATATAKAAAALGRSGSPLPAAEGTESRPCLPNSPQPKGLTPAAPLTVSSNGVVVNDGAIPGDVMVLAGGTFKGNGHIGGTLTNASGGLVIPGDPCGTNSVASNYVQSAGATLQIGLGGVSRSQYSTLAAGRAARLAGTLTVTTLNGFVPATGNQFQLLTSSNLTGAFTQLNLPAGTTVTYSNNAVFLTVIGSAPVQILNPVLTNGQLVFQFSTTVNGSYTVERNNTLAPADWVFYTNLTGNGTVMQVAVPVTEAARRCFRVRQP